MRDFKLERCDFYCNNALIHYMRDVMRAKVLRKKLGCEPLELYKFHLWLEWYRFSNTYTSIHVNCLSFIIPKFTRSSLIKITMHSWISWISTETTTEWLGSVRLWLRDCLSRPSWSRRGTTSRPWRTSRRKSARRSSCCVGESEVKGAGVWEKFCSLYCILAIVECLF